MSKERELMLQVAGSGYLGSYLGYTRTLTEAPLAYQMATGLSIIAAAVGSGASFVGNGTREHWPNLYCLLLGDSGTHKNTAIDLGCLILERAFPGVIAPNEFSREQFLGNLQQQPSTLMKVGEFSTLLAQMDRNYQGGLKEMLTDLYDPYQEYVRTLRGQMGKGETIRIRRPALSILGGSTPVWLTEHLKPVDFRSGFMPRFLMFPSELMEPDPGFLVAGDRHVQNSLVKQLHSIGSRALGQVASCDFSDQVKERMNRWTHTRRRQADEEGAPDELRGLISRSGMYAAKLSLLLCISDHGAQERYEITLEQAQRAMLLMGWLLDAEIDIFERLIVFEESEKLMQRFLSMIPNEGIDRSGHLRRLKWASKRYEEVLRTAVERGQARVESVRHDRAGRPSQIIYRLYDGGPGRPTPPGETSEEMGRNGEVIGEEIPAAGSSGVVDLMSRNRRAGMGGTS